MEQDLIAIARIRRAIGLEGLVGVETFGETLEMVEVPAEVLIGRNEKETRSIVITGIDLRPRGYVVKFEGVNDRIAAENLQECSVWIGRSQLPGLQEGQFYHFELIGMSVITDEGTLVGTVKEIQSYPAADTLEIDREGKTPILLPFTGSSILGVDKVKRCITISKSFLDELL